MFATSCRRGVVVAVSPGSRRPMVLLAIATSLLAACRSTRLEFRSPEASELVLASSPFREPLKVVFRSSIELPQAHRLDSENGKRCAGRVRIDGQIDTERLPPGAERYLVKDAEGTWIHVHGYYWVYFADATLEKELATHYVDITPEDIYSLLEGRQTTIEGGTADQPLYRFELGISFPSTLDQDQDRDHDQNREL